MTRMVNVHEAKSQLSRLLVSVELGEEVVIARAGKPVARLVPVNPEATHPRVFGGMRGQIRMPSPEDDARADEMIETLFEESVSEPL